MWESQGQSIINFTLPEFSSSRSIKWKVHVDNNTPTNQARYDMIMGTDLMEELGVDISFKHMTISWDGVDIPMKNRGSISDSETLHYRGTGTIINSGDPQIIQKHLNGTMHCCAHRSFESVT